MSQPKLIISTSPSKRRPVLIFFTSIVAIFLFYELLYLTFGASAFIEDLTLILLLFPLLILIRNIILHSYFIKYFLYDQYVETITGIVSRNGHRAGIDRITDFALRQSVIQRALGICSVLISTAGSDGFEFKFKDLPREVGKKLIEELTVITRANAPKAGSSV
jgi:uncharacterized membrane protein YdbT with pleckstrin-like domain